MAIPVYVVGEDGICCALAKSLLSQTGGLGVAAYEKNASGFGEFVKVIPKMNQVAHTATAVLMLADGDQHACIVQQIKNWMPAHPAKGFMLRLAVREAESWILADSKGFGKFAEISPAIIPTQPDLLPNPKEALLALIGKSKRRILREEMLPRKRSSAPVGLGYVLHLTDFLENYWCIKRASEASPSLARSVTTVTSTLYNF